MKKQGFIETAATFMPMIAAGLGSPIAGMAVNWIFKTLNKKPPADPTKALNAAKVIIETITPEDQVKLRASDADFKQMADDSTEIDLLDYQVKIAAIEAKDRDSARNMGIKSGNMKPQIALSIAVLIIFVFTLYLVFTMGPSKDNPILFMMMGVVSTAMTQVLNYWFGTSKSSADKTAALAGKPA